MVTLDSLYVHSFTSVLNTPGDEVNKTAIHLMEHIQRLTSDETKEQSQKTVELVIDEKRDIMTVSGVRGPVKIFSKTRKLLLICTAQENKAHFNIKNLKPGRYLLEAEHQFFEFVR